MEIRRFGSRLMHRIRDDALTVPARWETLAVTFGVGLLRDVVRQGASVANGTILDETQPVGKTLAVTRDYNLGSERPAWAWMGPGSIALIACVIAVALGACAGDTPGTAGKTYRIGISQCVRDPILDEVIAGMKEGVKARGYGSRVTYTLETSNFDQSLASTIATKFVTQDVDLIVAICTPNALAAERVTKTIPIVFSFVSDALGAGVVKSLKHPGGNVTGTQSFASKVPAVDMIKRVMPDARTIGIVVNPGDEATVLFTKRFREASALRGLDVVEAAANSTAEVSAAAQSLVGRVDAIYEVGNSQAVSAFPAIVKVADANDIPLFGTDLNEAKLGALVAVGEDPRGHGRGTGAIVAKILAGADPGDIPVWTNPAYFVAVNPSAARRQGISLPPSVITAADRTFK
jgi:putative ABC transport system substrate-binding protein